LLFCSFPSSTHREESIAGLRTEIRHPQSENPQTCPIPHPYPIPAGDGICLLGVPLDCKSYQNTLTESLRRSIRRNRSMPRARIFPNRIVGSDAPASFGLLRALKSFLLISIIYASRGVVCRPQNRNPTPTVGEPPSIHPSHHTCQISILRPFWTPLRCVDRKKEQKGIAKP
jgi:hypothetical protein